MLWAPRHASPGGILGVFGLAAQVWTSFFQVCSLGASPKVHSICSVSRTGTQAASLRLSSLQCSRSVGASRLLWEVPLIPTWYFCHSPQGPFQFSSGYAMRRCRGNPCATASLRWCSCFALVSWWEQYPDAVIPGSDCSDHRNSESFGLMCVGWPTSVSRFCFTSYRFLRREIHSWWRSPVWGETMAWQWERVDEDPAVGPRFGHLSANTSVHLLTF